MITCCSSVYTNTRLKNCEIIGISFVLLQISILRHRASRIRFKVKTKCDRIKTEKLLIVEVKMKRRQKIKRNEKSIQKYNHV